MILTGQYIESEVKNGHIHIEPFLKENVNPNSYNFRLDNKLLCYKSYPLNPQMENPTEEITIDSSGFELMPNKLYLANTMEVLGSDFYVPTYNARSSVARLGLFINLSASLCDIGFKGQLTIQLYATHPIKVYPGMEIGQIMFWKPKGEIELYQGKYQSSSGPQKSQIYKDFIKTKECVLI